MQRSTKIGLTTVVVAVAALAWWLQPAEISAPHPAAQPAPRDADLDVEPVSASPAPLRVAPNEAAPPDDAVLATEPWLAHPYEMCVAFRCVDADGLPTPDVPMRIAPVGVELGEPTTVTRDGRATLAWRSRVPSAEFVCQDPGGLLRRIRVHHDGETTIPCALPPRRRIEKIDWASPGTRGGETPTRRPLHPFATFASEAVAWDLSLDIGDPLPNWVVVVGSVPTDGPEAGGPRIRGVVVNEGGEPAWREPVAVISADGQRCLGRTTTDADGRFSILPANEPMLHVRIGGGANGVATIPATVSPTSDEARITLHPDACLRGRVTRSDGRSAANYVVTAHAENGSWCDAALTTGDGSFVIANAPADIVTVSAARPGAQASLPIATASRVRAGAGEIALLHEVAAEHAIRGTPVLPDECVGARIEIRVWQEDSGVGTVIRAKHDQPLQVRGLPPGSYHVEAVVRGCGFVDLGNHWLDGKNDVDLGRIVMPRPGRVRVAIANDALPPPRERHCELFALRTDSDVACDTTMLPDEHPLLAPAGEYAFAFRHRDGDVRFVRFTVRSGEETLVTAPE